LLQIKIESALLEQTFKRGERLKSRTAIEQLFKNGSSFGAYPLRLVYAPMEKKWSEFPIQFTVSVSKKKFKRAVDRNRVKRLVKEAWRLHKAVLYKALEEEVNQYAFLVIYTAKEIVSFQQIEKSMLKIHKKFLEQRTLIVQK
jgi:ribonuclease P protein component